MTVFVENQVACGSWQAGMGQEHLDSANRVCFEDEGGIGDGVLIRVLGTDFHKPDKGRRSTSNQETESSRTLVLGAAG